MSIQFTNLSKDEGAYDKVAEEVFVRTQSQGVILIVAGGNKGSGFSVCCQPHLIGVLVPVLRELADKIEEQTKAAKLS